MSDGSNGDSSSPREAKDVAALAAGEHPYPLHGVRVLDLSRVLAGPFVGRMLSDLGADVVKIEGPEGDVSRLWGEVRNGASGYYFQQNTGKRDMSIDLKAPGAAELVLRLAERADVVIENYRPGVMDKLGLAWSVLSARNPRLIMLSISGWGQTGPGAERRAFAPIIHAQTGLIERQSRVYGIPPVDQLHAIADHYAGLHGLVAMLAALYLRKDTGLGQHIDLAMFDAMLATDHYAHHFLDGSPFERLGGYVWEAVGGPILLAADYRHTWKQLRLAFDLEDPAPRGSDLTTKVAARREKIGSWMMSFASRHELNEALDTANLIHSDIVSSDDAFNGEDARVRGVIVEVGDGAGGSRKVVQSPYRFSHATSGVRAPAPRFGEHNEVVLKEWLGLDGDEVRELAAQGVFAAEEPRYVGSGILG